MQTTRKERFKQIFDSHYAALCGVARTYVSARADCEDIVQELFVTVWNSGRDALPEDELAAYLATAVRNNCISELRRRQRMDTVGLDDFPAGLPDEAPEGTDNADYGAMLQALLDTLPPKCRDVFVMSKLRKMKYKDIARELDISEKTVENHMGRAFKLIRHYVATHPVALLLLTLFHLTTKNL